MKVTEINTTVIRYILHKTYKNGNAITEPTAKAIVDGELLTTIQYGEIRGREAILILNEMYKNYIEPNLHIITPILMSTEIKRVNVCMQSSELPKAYTSSNSVNTVSRETYLEMYNGNFIAADMRIRLENAYRGKYENSLKKDTPQDNKFVRTFENIIIALSDLPEVNFSIEVL